MSGRRREDGSTGTATITVAIGLAGAAMTSIGTTEMTGIVTTMVDTTPTMIRRSAERSRPQRRRWVDQTCYVEPPGQTTPQLPQFWWSSFGSTHAAPHAISPFGHVVTQVPAAHASWALQGLPQSPQFPGSGHM